MGDLTADAAPLGEQWGDGRQAGTLPQPNTHKTPHIINIKDSTGVHIGPVYHLPVSRPPPQHHPAPHDRLLQREVDILLSCVRKVSDADKFVISEHLGSAWSSLGRRMGFSPGQLDNLRVDYPRGQDATYELLNKWNDREADAATVATLTQMLLDIKAFPVVKKLRP